MTKQGFIDLLTDEGWEWKEEEECKMKGIRFSKDLASYHLPYSAIEVMHYEYALNKLINGVEV